ncbi:MAG: hypothetical protein ACYC0V_07265 [Armatimonadota bacterium]
MSEKSSGQGIRSKFRTKLQIAVFLIVLIAALLQYTLPLTNRESRAEKLYIDSWFQGSTFFSWMMESITDTFPDDDEKRKMSISKLEKALLLSPGNSMYEQALAKQYPPKDLPKLLADSKLGNKARWLAHYRYYLYSARTNSANMDEIIRAECQKPERERKYHVNGAHVYPDQYLRENLRNLDELAAVIPGYPPIYLHRATIYGDMMQYDKMMANIRKANNMNPYNAISIDRLPQLDQTILTYAEEFVIYQSYTSKLTTQTGTYGNQLLRGGKVDEAIRVHEDLCRLGVKYAQQEPQSINTMMTGISVFFRGWDRLRPLYKDFGYADRLEGYNGISGILLNAYEIMRDGDERSTIYKTSVFDIFYWYLSLLILIIIGIIISALTWTILIILQKRRTQESYQLTAWQNGWLVKRFVIIYGAVFTLMLILTGIFPYISIPTFAMMSLGCMHADVYAFYNTGTAASLLTQVVMSILLIRKLRLEYRMKTGDNIGITRFIFNPPAEIGVWICKSFTRMYAAQLIFLTFILMVGAIYYKATLDFYPWQPERVRIFDTRVRDAVVQKAGIMLEEASSKLHTPEDR